METLEALRLNEHFQNTSLLRRILVMQDGEEVGKVNWNCLTEKCTKSSASAKEELAEETASENGDGKVLVGVGIFHQKVVSLAN